MGPQCASSPPPGLALADHFCVLTQYLGCDKRAIGGLGVAQFRGVPASPLAKRYNHWLKTATQGCRAVFNPRWDLAKNLAMHQTVLFHLAQLVNEHLLADARKQSLQLREALRAGEEVIEDDDLPAAGNHLKRSFGWQQWEAFDRIDFYAYLYVSIV
jgi:hypothetical protein